jgi:hypothetical protein
MATATNTNPSGPISTSVRRVSTTAAVENRGTSRIVLIPTRSVCSCAGASASTCVSSTRTVTLAPVTLIARRFKSTSERVSVITPLR